jgi:flagellar hook protein FlgE
VAAAPNTFNSLSSLGNLVAASAGLSSTLNNPLGTSSLTMAVVNPQDTIVFTDGAGNTGSLLAQLGLVTSLNGGAFVQQTTGTLGPAYDPTVTTKNMASGAIAPQFSRPVSIFDALGTSHNLNVAFAKTNTNTWAVEIYAQPESDITPASSALIDGQVATGTITFNGDGSLQSVSPGLLAAIPINWTNGSLASTVAFNWGTAGLPFGTPNAAAIGKTDGMTQFASGYNVSFVNQNGSPVGQLTGISIDGDGFITASYNNGQTSRLYKIPLGSFTAPNNLQARSGNSYSQSNSSGVVNLKQAGQSGVGTISAGALEASNVELAGQLTDMIVAQRAYQANTKVIQTADNLLNDLGQIIR